MLNQQIIIGNLGSDPELRYTGNGTAVCDISVATTHRKKSGEEYEKVTTWHKATLWGKLAENANRYLRKGSKAYVSGRTEHQKYDDKEGVTRYMTKIIANDVIYLDSAETRKQSGGYNYPTDPPPTNSQPVQGSIGDGDDDYPF